jgi:hypothetical protein
MPSLIEPLRSVASSVATALAGSLAGRLAHPAAAAALAAVLVPAAFAQGTPIGFEETYALATDRGAVLGRLAPGTDDFYWYHCLNAQGLGDLDAVPPLLAEWIARHGRSARTQSIEHRQALLAYERDPEGAYAYLVRTLGLSFDRRAEIPGADPSLPARLDPQLVATAALEQRALADHPDSLNGFADAYLDELYMNGAGGAALVRPRVDDLLRRLERGDLPGIEDLLLRETADKARTRLTSLPIFAHLSLAQLERCATANRALLEEQAFVDGWLQRLRPGPDVDLVNDRDARAAHLDRLEAFARQLPPSFDSLLAQVLLARLAHEFATGRVDEGRLAEFLGLPHGASWASEAQRSRAARSPHSVDLGRTFQTGLSVPRDAEPLLRELLLQLFAEAPDIGRLGTLVERRFAERLFAEAKLLAGVGDRQRWYALYDDPSGFAELEQRVDLDFAPTQARQFAVDAPVSVALDVKNVPTLIVKVYALDALSWCTANGSEVPADIALDGLAATSERTFTYGEEPLRRVRRSFDFPELAGPGVWVLEFIGNGSASRMLVRKGSLALTERLGAAGHVFRAHDETGAPAPDATIHFAGRVLRADERGEIVVPFSTAPGTRTVVVASGRRVSTATFEHRAESYALEASFFVEREELLGGGRARLLVRPRLFAADAPASLALLESRLLRVVAVDRDGVETSLEVRDVELDARGEYVLELAVPERLARLSATLSGTVESAIGGDATNVSARSQEFSLADVEATPWTSVPLLGRTSQGYHVDVLGRNGEPRAARALTVTLEHADFTERTAVVLQSDARGRIELGPLAGVTHVTVAGPEGSFGRWTLAEARRSHPGEQRAVLGEAVLVPYGGRATELTRDDFSLVSVRGGVVVADQFRCLSLGGGNVVIRGLPAGDHLLFLHELDQTVRVRVVDGERRGDLAVARQRLLELGDPRGLSIVGIDVSADAVRVRLTGHDTSTRVHLVATRWLPANDPFASLDLSSYDGRSACELVQPSSDLDAERDLGDEFRYILERRLSRVFPGNMLRRPSLLLDPWDIGQVAQSVEGRLSAPGALGGGGGGRRGGRAGGARTNAEAGGDRSPGTFADLDFLARGAAVVANLRPAADGSVVVPRASLLGNQHVHVLAIDDEHTLRRSIALDEVPFERIDQRLAVGLDRTGAFGERRALLALASGARTTIADVGAASFETFESLADVYALFATLAPSTDLARFAPLVRWPSLSTAEKQAFHSEHACHELRLFLHEHDRPFFDAVVRPYLEQKLAPTFLDEYLLGRDLSSHLEPRAFARLNAVERVLLGRRLPAQRAHLARLAEEQFALLPPEQVARLEQQLHRAALATGGLDADAQDDKAGYKGAGDTVPPGAARRLAENEPAQSPGAPTVTGSADFFLADGAPAEDSNGALERLADAESDELRSRAAELSDRLDADGLRRRQSRGFYQAPRPTRAFAESNYWRRRIVEHEGALVSVDRFWLDFARSAPDAPFVSPHFAAASDSLNEMLLALAVLDLPFVAEGTERTRKGSGLELTAGTPLVLVLRDVAELPRDADAPPVLVSQDFFRLDEPMRFDGTRMVDAFVEDEFLVDTAYGCRVVVTNPTSSARDLDVLLQVPAGAIAVRGSVATRGYPVRLEAYATTTLEYAFYFPQDGAFGHFPATVSQDGRVVAAAAGDMFDVRTEPSRVDTRSWEYVSQRGTPDEVFAYLEAANLAGLDLSRLAWRCSDRGFFERVTTHLAERLVYAPDLWSYALMHRDAVRTAQYLRHVDWFVAQVGPWLASPLLSIDAVERRTYEHLEFAPLVNARAHQVSARRELLNASVAAQYQALLAILCLRPTLDDADWAAVTYHMLLQDRVEEALAAFARIDRARLGADLQYDYMAAYLDFFTDDRRLARGLAERYVDHPVDRWRLLFREVVQQLDEAEGRTASLVDPDDAAQRQTALAGTEPALELALAGRRLELAHANLSEVEIGYYPMDVEFLFSARPFAAVDEGAVAWVEPRRRDRLALVAGARSTAFELPAEFATANVLVEVRGGGIVRRATVLASTLAVQWVETFGELRVTQADSGRPLSKVYVKVYARDPDGTVRFHKDGYTDLRGRFDYASLSGEGGTGAERFAVLVLSDEHGAVVRDVAPPQR